MMRRQALERRVEALEARVDELTGDAADQDPVAYWETVLALPRRATKGQAEAEDAEASLCRRCRRAVRTITSGRPQVICLLLPDNAICPDRDSDRFFAGIPRVTECGHFRPAKLSGKR